MIDGTENVGARTGDIVREAYAGRSREYVDLFGSMTSTHPSDRTPVGSWAARAQYPHLSFGLGSFETLDAGAESLGEVLAWYSLIHHRPQDIRISLAEFARVIRPGGGLLVGFFEGPMVEPFDHAATRAYRWPVAELRRELAAAGFEVVETHTRTGSGQRPHGAVTARRQNRDSRLVRQRTR
ncbi:class I SAM-dependent methyltransferase [Prescottella agglutinans]|uniref:class I SAM-dependent methyltransferase n=1 Tax=Prescottella agglutinans TaxID=1644129 RepID=UPI003D96D546